MRKTDVNVNLVEVPKSRHEMYQLEPSFDYLYQINNENEIPIGLVFLSDMMDGTLYIEWLEIMVPFHGRGYLRKTMEKLVELFHKEIHFECSEELRFKYMKVGCNEHGINEITELYRMSYNEKYKIKSTSHY